MPPTTVQATQILPSWETISPTGTVVVQINDITGIDTSGANDATALINAANASALNAMPNAPIIDRFGTSLDTYDIQGEVTLYNDMAVEGGGATIVTNPKSDWQTSVGQFVNQAATPLLDATPANAAINRNISVRGLVFYYPEPVWNVPIWIQNATNVDVQDDVFMAASNGQQFFVNVKNAIVANVVSVGNINGALNGWNGLQNIAITGTYVSNAGSAAGSGGSWFNGTSNPNGVLGGSQSNNYAVGNVTEGVFPGGDAMALGPLHAGVTASAVDIFGSTDAIGGTPSTFGYIQTNTQFSYQAYNIATGYVAGNPEQTNLFNMSSTGTASGFPVSSNDVMTGNLAVGSTRMFQDFQATGADITLIDNALINGQAGYPQEYQPLVGPVGGVTGAVIGQTGELSGSPIVGGPVAAGLTLRGPLQEFDTSAGIIPITGTTLTVASPTPLKEITVTASDIFGYLISNDHASTTISYTGDLTAVNAFLGSLYFSPSSSGWDDEIHFEASSPGQVGSIWDIPIKVGTSTISGSLASTYSIAENSFQYNPSSGSGISVTGSDTFTSLGGNTLVGSFEPISGTLAGDIRAAVVGTGGGTIVGTTIGQRGAIAGIGPIDAILSRGGDDTITPGMAGATVDAALGNDLIQSNEGFVTATLGEGQSTVILGLGGGDIVGGTGFDTIINLPDNAGPVNLSLGVGGGAAYLLSGENNVITTESANSSFDYGIGNTTMTSHGNDTIHAGAGALRLTVGRGAQDILTEGVGGVTINGAGGDLYIDPFFTVQPVPNSSSLAVAGNPVPAETFVAEISGLAGSFGAVGGAILANSTFGTRDLLSATALVDSSVTLNGLLGMISTLSMNGDSSIMMAGNSAIHISSIAPGALIEAVGDDVILGGSSFIIGNETVGIDLTTLDTVAFSGGASNTISAHIVDKSALMDGTPAPDTTYLMLTTDVGLSVDSIAAAPVRDAFSKTQQAGGGRVDSLVLAGQVSLSAAPATGGNGAWVDVNAQNASGTLTLPGGVAGEVVRGRGDLELVSEVATTGPLIFGAGVDVSWKDVIAGNTQETVIGAGGNNRLDIEGRSTDVIEYGGKNVISIGGGPNGTSCSARVLTDGNARDVIDITQGIVSIDSRGLDSVRINSSVVGSDIYMRAGGSSVVLGPRVQGASIALRGGDEAAEIMGTNNTVVGSEGGNITVGGYQNIVVDSGNWSGGWADSLSGTGTPSSLIDVGQNDTLDASGIAAASLDGGNGVFTINGAGGVALDGTNNTLVASNVQTIVGAMIGGKVVAGAGVGLVDLSARDGGVAVTVAGNASAVVNGDRIDYRSSRGFIAADSGNNYVNMNPVAGAEGMPIVYAIGGALTVKASGSGMIVGGDASLRCLGGAGDVTVTSGVGSVDFTGDKGRMSVHGGALGKNVLRAGDATGTLFGAGPDNLLVGGSARSTLVAGVGTTTMVGGTGFTRMLLGTGTDTVEMSTISGAVSEVAVGGGGNVSRADLVLGWSGSNALQLLDGTEIVAESIRSDIGAQVSLSNGATILFSNFFGSICAIRA